MSIGSQEGAWGLLSLGRQHRVLEPKNLGMEKHVSTLEKNIKQIRSEKEEVNKNLQKKTEEADRLRAELERTRQECQRGRDLIKNGKQLDALKTLMIACLTRSLTSAQTSAEQRGLVVKEALALFGSHHADAVLHAVLAKDQNTRWAFLQDLVVRRYNPLSLYLKMADQIRNGSGSVARSVQDMCVYVSKMIDRNPQSISIWCQNHAQSNHPDLENLWDCIKSIKSLSKEKETTFDVLNTMMKKFQHEPKFVKYLNSMIFDGMGRLCESSSVGLFLTFGIYFENSTTVKDLCMEITEKASMEYLRGGTKEYMAIERKLESDHSENVSLLWHATKNFYDTNKHPIMYILELSKLEIFEDMKTLAESIWQRVIEGLNNVDAIQQQMVQDVPMQQEQKDSPSVGQSATPLETRQQEICLHGGVPKPRRPSKRLRAVPVTDARRVVRKDDATPSSHVVSDKTKVQCHFQGRFFTATGIFPFGDLDHLKTPLVMTDFKHWFQSCPNRCSILQSTFEHIYTHTNWSALLRDESESQPMDEAFEAIERGEFIDPNLLGSSKHLSPWQVFHRVQMNGGFEHLSNEGTWDEHFPSSGLQVKKAYVDLIEGAEFECFLKSLEEYNAWVLRRDPKR